ncbi:MAG: hypothetical protein AAF242_04870, partial [Bacteroidota bacterium]
MRVRTKNYWLLCLFLLASSQEALAHINPKARQSQAAARVEVRSFRENCDNAISQTDMDINNVRARLTTGGDVWWDSNDGRYVVPKVPPGQPEVSSIFAGAVWLGGVDPAGNLKVAAQTYGRNTGNFDYWPGPLNPETGTTTQEECAKWDKFFTVTGQEIDQHLRNWEEAKLNGTLYDPDDIPFGVKGWPARGNEFFFDIHEFELPNTTQGLAGFWDQDGDGLYNPELGDFPVIEVRGCLDKPQYPDEMTFWIYNDAGNIHAESMGDPIQMEVQVQAFAYATNDEINDMTFQRYKLINRAVESIDSTYFAMWVDPDLGCSTDDYIGCDTSRSLAFVYNEDALDGQTGCSCPGGVNTYCDEIPILGVDYFRGPLDELGNEIGMSSFTYYNNAGIGSPQQGTTDPDNALEYYYYLSGRWKDGSPFTFGDDAYRDGFPIQYAFTETPDDPTGWSMCTSGLPFGDRRTIQASGPFRLDPGAVNELIIGAVFVADQAYPCPSLTKLLEADDIAQALFDNCFEITDGPDAPDVDFIELDKEIVAVFTNDSLTSNNAFEAYAQPGLQIPAGEEDSLYVFEGYKLYQLSGAEVTIADLDDPDKARLIYQADIKNGINRIFNWRSVDNPTGEELFVPELEVEGVDQGIQHTFRITEDQFAEGDRRLINHRKYYFTAIAYAYNNYSEYDPTIKVGQRRPYLEGRRNIGDGDNPFYTVIPRPIVDRNLNTFFGDGAIITRLDGVGNGGVFLDLDPAEREALITGENTSGEITYRPGAGPIDVKIYNPLDVQDGEFELRFFDGDMGDDEVELSSRWRLENLNDPNDPIIISEQTISELNEQIIKEFGFSISVGQVDPVGTDPFINTRNGAIGYDQEYTGDTGVDWVNGVPDGFVGGPAAFDQQAYDYVATLDGEADAAIDPNQALTNIGPGYFIPYYLANWRAYDENDAPYITPAWTNLSGNSTVRTQSSLDNLVNVDIVMTPNKELWSRCVIIETVSRHNIAEQVESEGNRQSFDLRAAANVTRFDNDRDGLPDIDDDNPGEGMGWFPGYAINVETGERLNIFFGENSIYANSGFPDLDVGRDMMFNPSSLIVNLDGPNISSRYVTGGHHFIYVANTPYNECEDFRRAFAPSPSFLTKVRAMRDIVWTGIVLPEEGTNMLSYEDGLIPNEVVLKLRINSPYAVAEDGPGANQDHPAYRFRIEGKNATPLETTQFDEKLKEIQAVPNPYFGFSSYEVSQFTNVVKITNLPAQCVVTIYTLDGKFIRQYNRNEVGTVPIGVNRAINRQQISPALEWDMRNSKGIPIASGVYLIHVDAGELGERT